ncbi:MAG: amidohydrolase [Deltaproteobacteria bacterium]|nr:amidohydrolase [Deltaproteobacteria bacterium]
MKIIDLENHFFTNDYIKYLRSRQKPPRETGDSDGYTMWYNDVLNSPRSFEMANRLLDLGENRLQEMDELGIDIQLLSLSPPGVQGFEPEEGTAWSRKVNDELSKVVKQNPDRFLGLACIAPQSPEEAADELDRAVSELGLKGANIESHARNEYLDDKKYWCIFERAEKLDVPLFLHPEIPSISILKGYADDYGFELAGPPHGYAADLALHTMRLIYSGLFDKYSKLKMVLGHMGEGMPFWLSRMDAYWIKPWKGTKPRIEKKPSDYIKRNFTVTIGGMFYAPALLCAHLALGADKIAFAVDYPYEKTEQAVRFIKEAPISDIDKEKIFYSNAARLLKI